jgi:hypothetical protein
MGTDFRHPVPGALIAGSTTGRLAPVKVWMSDAGGVRDLGQAGPTPLRPVAGVD